MPILHSEDKSLKSRLEIKILKDQIKNKPEISWIPYELFLVSGEKSITYKKNPEDNGAGDYVFALVPANEILNISKGIKNFLSDANLNMYSFEPLEPSFEIIIEKSHKGFSFTCWVDAGNVITDHYTWDGFGVRFFTTEENILKFAEGLEKEAEDLKQIAEC